MSLSVHNSEQALLLGESRDFASCAHPQKCSTAVNVQRTRLCVRHTEERFKASRFTRHELNNVAEGPTYAHTALRVVRCVR